MTDASRKYSFDTSALINTWAVHYRPKSFPGLWRELEGLIDKGIVVASEEVLEEVRRQDDDLLKWCNARKRMFIPHEEPIQRAARGVLAKHPRLIDARAGRHGADPFVIALGQVLGLTVVTYESGTATEKRPNIPFVCGDLGVRCVRFTDFIEEQGWVFR